MPSAGSASRTGSARPVRHRLEPPLRQPPPCLVPRDAKQPWQNRRARRRVAPSVLDHGNEHVLRDVFRRRRRTGHVEREAIDVRPPASVERPERVAVPHRHSRNQFLVRLGHRRRLSIFGRGLEKFPPASQFPTPQLHNFQLTPKLQLSELPKLPRLPRLPRLRPGLPRHRAIPSPRLGVLGIGSWALIESCGVVDLWS